ncbi:MAG: N-acetylmuramoyl-L-alanine amidase, partial [Clostridia bacterium]|nr:N-acetylmuramoyl-L-alanine amidase [Clostridia bacterium]
LKMQDLKNRLDISKQHENSIFISIHMNKFSEEKYSGLQVFYSQNSDESAVLASKIQSKVKEHLQNDNDRETKKANSNIYLLDNIETPAILIECGFLSNPDECTKLSSEDYRKELAGVIYSSVVEFLDEV